MKYLVIKNTPVSAFYSDDCETFDRYDFGTAKIFDSRGEANAYADKSNRDSIIANGLYIEDEIFEYLYEGTEICRLSDAFKKYIEKHKDDPEGEDFEKNNEMTFKMATANDLNKLMDLLLKSYLLPFQVIKLEEKP